MKALTTNKVSIVVALIGAAGGFFYWYLIGCASGNCSITANWETSVGVGTLMGWLVGDMIKDKNKK
jgi:hypothetical protein